MKHKKFLQITAKIAEDVTPVANARIAASVVFRNEIIAFGTCQYKTHPFQDKFKPNPEARYWHAETNAIFNALKRVHSDDLKKASLYIARVKYVNGQLVWGLAKPCSGCQSAIDMFQIKNVFYTSDSQEVIQLS